jgi:hypothetical protein
MRRGCLTVIGLSWMQYAWGGLVPLWPLDPAADRLP